MFLLPSKLVWPYRVTSPISFQILCPFFPLLSSQSPRTICPHLPSHFMFHNHPFSPHPTPFHHLPWRCEHGNRYLNDTMISLSLFSYMANCPAVSCRILRVSYLHICYILPCFPCVCVVRVNASKATKYGFRCLCLLVYQSSFLLFMHPPFFPLYLVFTFFIQLL